MGTSPQEGVTHCHHSSIPLSAAIGLITQPGSPSNAVCPLPATRVYSVGEDPWVKSFLGARSHELPDFVITGIFVCHSVNNVFACSSWRFNSPICMASEKTLLVSFTSPLILYAICWPLRIAPYLVDRSASHRQGQHLCQSQLCKRHQMVLWHQAWVTLSPLQHSYAVPGLVAAVVVALWHIIPVTGQSCTAFSSLTSSFPHPHTDMSVSCLSFCCFYWPFIPKIKGLSLSQICRSQIFVTVCGRVYFFAKILNPRSFSCFCLHM